ncbi:unnamed protein product [Orchesella dallaii]|uniref:Uncharacterized protein n=1 Tax=Orchesella dallaii TaxID=48710 RepID=A0ABP1RRC8_9HEXA
MEWSTGLDEDSTDGSETLQERSMKNVELLSSTTFILVESCCNYLYYFFLIFLCTLGVSLSFECKNTNFPLPCCYHLSYSQNCSLNRCGTSAFSPAVISAVCGLLDVAVKGFQFSCLSGVTSVELLRKRLPTLLLVRSGRRSQPACALAVDAISAPALFKLTQFDWTSDFVQYAHPDTHYLDENLQCEDLHKGRNTTTSLTQGNSHLHFSCANRLNIIEKHALDDENKSHANWNILMTSVAEKLEITADVDGDEHTAPSKTIRSDCALFESQLNRPKNISYWMRKTINHVLAMTTAYIIPVST